VNRQVLLVALLFAVATTAATVVVASSASVGAALSGGDRLATLPIAIGLTGGVLATVPASRAMAAWGRRRGFQIFAVIGLLGALGAAAAIGAGSFLGFCAASFFIGAMVGSAQYYRYTAGELAGADGRERALGYALAGGVVGGLLGPQLATWASDVVGAKFVGTYLVVAVMAVLNLLLLPFLDAVRPGVASQGPQHGKLVVDRPLVAAILAGMLAYGAMVLTMYAAPLSLHAEGHPFSTAAHVLQAHVVAMYLPSFFTGALVARWGSGRGMATGIAFLAACIATNVAGDSVLHHGVALVLLGIGWNLLFVAATALLARTHGGADKASAQGMNEFLVGTSSAGAAFLAGPMHHALGWVGLNLAVAALVGLVSMALLLLGSQPTPSKGVRGTAGPPAGG
jgi:MFS family permease